MGIKDYDNQTRRNYIMSKKLVVLFLVTLMLALPVSGFADGHESIVDIAVEDGRFTVLVAALQEADLVDTLAGEGPYTVFAPTDDAFTALLSQLNITAEDLLGHPQLADVLLYHVVAGQVMSTDLSDGMTAATVQGENVTVSLDGGVFIDQAEVIIADIEANNGVIHVLDSVLVPDAFQLAQPEETPETGTVGAIPFMFAAAAAASGIVALRRK